MPYYEGKRVSNAEWHRLKGHKPLTWKEAVGYGDPEKSGEAEPVAEEPPKVPKRHGKKKAEAEAAMAAITGLDIDLGDTEEKDNDNA